MLHARRDVSTKSRVAITRTPLSLAFEDFYRALPVDGGRVPGREAFRPERAGKFLKHLVLCEAVGGLRMRIVGGAVQDRSQRNLKGENYLDYLLPEFHAAAMFVIRELVARPCGLWQVQPMLSEHGAVQSTELTVFPLGPGADGVPLLLVLTQDSQKTMLATYDKMKAAGSLLSTQYIDLGAGVPG